MGAGILTIFTFSVSFAFLPDSFIQLSDGYVFRYLAYIWVCIIICVRWVYFWKIWLMPLIEKCKFVNSILLSTSQLLDNEQWNNVKTLVKNTQNSQSFFLGIFNHLTGIQIIYGNFAIILCMALACHYFG